MANNLRKFGGKRLMYKNLSIIVYVTILTSFAIKERRWHKPPFKLFEETLSSL